MATLVYSGQMVQQSRACHLAQTLIFISVTTTSSWSF